MTRIVILAVLCSHRNVGRLVTAACIYGQHKYYPSSLLAVNKLAKFKPQRDIFAAPLYLYLHSRTVQILFSIPHFTS